MRRGIGRLRAGGSGFSPASLFAAGEQGVWIDPSDLSSMFQDSAGTTPAAIESPVGKINDKSGRGNHLIQATAASRPTLSARYNKLTKTELLTDASWVPQAAGTGVVPTVTAGFTDPSATTKAFRVQCTGGGAANYSVVISPVATSATGMTQRGKVWMKSNTGASQQVTFYVSTAGGGISAASCTVTTAWQLFDTGVVTSTGAAINLVFGSYPNVAAADNNLDFLVAFPDLRTSADFALNIPAYQRVDTATSYDTSGFPMYLLADGVDDGMASAATVDLSGTNKLTAFGGLTKSSDAAAGMLVELTADATANNGGFALTAPASAAANYSFITRGTVAAATRTATTYTAPTSNVLTCSFDNSAGTTATQVIPRVNALTPTLADSAASSAGNFANSTLYVGRRGGTTVPFNGRLYQLIIRGATSTAAEIASAERYVGSKMGIAL